MYDIINVKVMLHLVCVFTLFLCVGSKFECRIKDSQTNLGASNNWPNVAVFVIMWNLHKVTMNVFWHRFEILKKMSRRGLIYAYWTYIEIIVLVRLLIWNN